VKLVLSTGTQLKSLLVLVHFTAWVALIAVSINLAHANDYPNGTDNLPMPTPPAKEDLAVFDSLVEVNATVSSSARTAREYGTRRSGNGVVLDASGLIVTIGYVVAEAQSIEVTFSSGETNLARVVAFDDHTGLALLRPFQDIVTTPAQLGKSKGLKKDQKVMILGGAGRDSAQTVSIGKISRFAGGWGYVVDDAIHTHPPNTDFSGSALLTEAGELVGIGALVSIDIDIDPKVRVPGNVFVPVDQLTGVLGQLIVSGRQEEQRAWLGMEARKTKEGMVVSRVMEGGPAADSGIASGDRIVAVNQQAVSSLADFYDKVWQSTAPGESVHLLLLRGDHYANVPIEAISIFDWLQLDASVSQLTELDD
jgi:S1-C subfamily serine protease